MRVKPKSRIESPLNMIRIYYFEKKIGECEERLKVNTTHLKIFIERPWDLP